MTEIFGKGLDNTIDARVHQPRKDKMWSRSQRDLNLTVKSEEMLSFYSQQQHLKPTRTVIISNFSTDPAIWGRRGG